MLSNWKRCLRRSWCSKQELFPKLLLLNKLVQWTSDCLQTYSWFLDDNINCWYISVPWLMEIAAYIYLLYPHYHICLSKRWLTVSSWFTIFKVCWKENFCQNLLLPVVAIERWHLVFEYIINEFDWQWVVRLELCWCE